MSNEIITAAIITTFIFLIAFPIYPSLITSYPKVTPYDYVTGVRNTGSMEPLINENSTIYSNRVDNISDLKVGDIIIFKLDYMNTTILHRIVNITDKRCIETRGDNIEFNDPYCLTANEIKYKVVKIEN